MYIIFAIVLLGIMFVCTFILGGIFTRHMMMDALKPYIPPTINPRAPRAKIIPHMNTLNRLLREGKRGTIMVRAGDRRK